MLGEQKWYLVIRRIDGERHTMLANSAQGACERLSWLVGDCCIRELREVPVGSGSK